jgi:hypothetical protein
MKLKNDNILLMNVFYLILNGLQIYDFFEKQGKKIQELAKRE